jgi:tetratricopeptide (TPR) repeat protein/tRNA A-37 threonylcarbamoyl transferase component Bud32
MRPARHPISLRSVSAIGQTDDESTVPIDGDVATVTQDSSAAQPGGPQFSDIEGRLLFAQVHERMFAGTSAVRVGRYRLRRRLGAGAMGEVHLAIDEDLDRPIAIKLVHRHLASHRWADGLRQEARALARLAHANVVHVYEVGEFEGRVYLAMECIEGTSLREWIRSERPTWEQVLLAYLDAARGLAAAHGAGVVHRDFKPDNVLRADDGRVAVADFGLAALEQREPSDSRHRTTIDEDLASYSRSGEIKGTPAYMPPEQFLGHADPRADQFALCVSLYEGLWDRRPFIKRSIDEVLRGHVDWTPLPPPRKSAVASWLWPILRRGLAPKPEDRWPNVDELIAAIEQARLARRKRARLLVSGLAVLGVGLLSGIAAAWLATPEVIDDCAMIDAELDGTWDAQQRGRMLDLFTGAADRSGGAWLGDSGELVAGALDGWRAAWLDDRAQLCHARVGGDPVVLDRHGACLERQRREAAAMIELLLAGTPEALREAPLAVQSLPDPGTCEAEARQGGPAAPAPAIAEAVERVREQLPRLEAELVTRQLEHARTHGEALMVDARELEDVPLRAEVALLLGRVLLAQNSAEPAFEVLEQAVDLAEGSRHDRVAADAWRWMATYAATETRELDRGRRWLRRADAAAVRIGVEPLATARLDYARANLQLLTDDERERERGIELLELTASALEQRGDLMYASFAVSDLGTALLGRGQTQRALAAFERALALRVQVYGPRHPEVGLAAYNLGQATLEVGEFEHARPLLQRAVEIWGAGQSVGGLELGRAHVVLAQIELEAGRFERALEHAREAAESFGRSLGPTQIEHAEVAVLAATAHYFLAQPQQAVDAYRRAVAGYADAHGADDLYTGYYRVALGWALLAAGEVDAARGEFVAGRAVIEAKLGVGTDESVDVRLGLIAVDLVSGSVAQAEAALAQLSAPPPDDLNHVTYELLRGLAKLRIDPSDPEGAAALGRAHTQARSIAGAQAMLAVLLDSLHADAHERRIAEQ